MKTIVYHSIVAILAISFTQELYGQGIKITRVTIKSFQQKRDLSSKNTPKTILLKDSAGPQPLIKTLPPNETTGKHQISKSAKIQPETNPSSALSLTTILNQETMNVGASPTGYDALSSMPGVVQSIQGFLFKSVSQKGVNNIANPRFVQYIDGMDNQLPGFNFPLGNLLGVADIDLDNIEWNSISSSFLQGSRDGNTALLMQSKSPFNYSGISAQFRVGINHFGQQQAPDTWEDMSLRFARVLSRKLAFKVAVSYTQGEDWVSENISYFDRLNMTLRSGSRYTNADYDGVNTYGDEPNTHIPNLQQIAENIKKENPNVPCHCLPEPQRSIVTAFNKGLLPSTAITRTGYAERELADMGTNSLKTIGAIHYKISPTIEAIAQVNWRKGNTTFTDVERYALKDVNYSQYKLELKGKEFFARAYNTRLNSGQSYNVTLLGNLINNQWKTDNVWINDYAYQFAKARLSGDDETNAHNIARKAADKDRPEAGSASFNLLRNNLTHTNAGIERGAGIYNKSNLYHYEGAYNFSGLFNHKIDWIIGNSYRTYRINSDGTFFNDYGNGLRLDEYLAYTQMGIKITNKIRLNGLFRATKNTNFDWLYAPGIGGTWTINPKNIIQASYQLSYRTPTIQNQYNDFQAFNTSVRVIGGLPETLSRYNLYKNRAFTSESYRNYLKNPSSLLEEYSFSEKGIQPEKVQTMEVRYNTMMGYRFMIDVSGYYNRYHQYIAAIDLFQALSTGDMSAQNMVRYYVPVNMNRTLDGWGGTAAIAYRLKKLVLSTNFSYNNTDQLPVNFNEGFNLPQNLVNFSISSSDIVKNIGFNFSYRWQQNFYWNSPFVSASIPSFGALDGQLSFKIPTYNSTIKLGGSNLLNQYYHTSYGNPMIGGMYYISLLFNETLK